MGVPNSGMLSECNVKMIIAVIFEMLTAKLLSHHVIVASSSTASPRSTDFSPSVAMQWRMALTM